MEGPILRAVDILVPGVSSLTKYVRYYELYAALAAYAEEYELDAEECHWLLRRCEVVLAAVSQGGGWPGAAHGIDRVRRSLVDGGLDLAGAADGESPEQSYSPRAWGFWAQYRGPSQTLGTVKVMGGALRPGRHECPTSLRARFVPLIEAAARDHLTLSELEALAPLALQSEEVSEISWLLGLFTATKNRVHDPEEWESDDLRRRAIFRILGRSTALFGAKPDHDWESLVESAVVFGGVAESDPVLREIREVVGWRGVLLRNSSVSAWRRLWAELVKVMGADGSGSGSSREELCSWLADQMPDITVRGFLAELPATSENGHPAPGEQRLIEDKGHGPLTEVGILLLGGRRVTELDGEVRTAFLGAQRDFLNPQWVALQTGDFLDRPLRDLAVRLVDDMLAQARRVALSKMESDRQGVLHVFSRVHERNGRYYKTSDESDNELGTRLEQLAGISGQLGLIDAREGTARTLTALGAEILEVVG